MADQHDQEDRLWHELLALLDSLTDEEAATPGYYADGWSAQDAVGHIGAWLAEAGIALAQIRMGTYHPAELDVDALNAAVLAGLKELSYHEIRAQAAASRWRMRDEWSLLASPDPEADRWLAKAGIDHYREHLPRLRDWVAELHARR